MRVPACFSLEKTKAPCHMVLGKLFFCHKMPTYSYQSSTKPFPTYLFSHVQTTHQIAKASYISLPSRFISTFQSNAKVLQPATKSDLNQQNLAWSLSAKLQTIAYNLVPALSKAASAKAFLLFLSLIWLSFSHIPNAMAASAPTTAASAAVSATAPAAPSVAKSPAVSAAEASAASAAASTDVAIGAPAANVSLSHDKDQLLKSGDSSKNEHLSSIARATPSPNYQEIGRAHV